MKKIQKDYLSIPEVAKLLHISRIAVFNKVKNGQIKAIRVGRAYAIARTTLDRILGKILGQEDKREIDRVVHRTVAEYGETLKLLGNE
jgi:excisionase family DNA binding protein